MPTYEVELSDGRKFHVDADGPPSEQDVMQALGSGAPEPAPKEDQGSGGATAAVSAARMAPAALQLAARAAANHPAATQKIIGAGISTGASAVGAGIGGVPGAVVGASIRGVTPAQAVIRETAGRLAGETPAVASAAGKAQSVIEYAKPLGYRLKPSDLAAAPEIETQLRNFAGSAGQKVVQLYGPEGTIVNGGKDVAGARFAPGPMVNGAVSAAEPGIMSKTLTAAKALSRILAPIQGATAMTDLAQAAEPTRTDIGVMGIGKSQPTPTMTPEQIQQANAQHQQTWDAQAQRQAQLKARLLSLLGMQ